MIPIVTLPPLTLYIHIPWCVRKCPYCDFNSHMATQSLPEQEYINALLADLTNEKLAIQNRPIQSIFIGGGTPSLFTPESYDRLFNALTKHFSLTKNIEITLEANPGTVEQQKFVEYHKLGINRLSLGIQSFQSSHLQALGRIHTAREALRAIDMAHNAGFSHLNIDLMHGLPKQTLHQALADLQQAIDLKPDHLSWYQLTIEPNTIYWSSPPTLPDEEQLWVIQEQGQSLLAEHGYQQYEISAYANSPAARAQHNLNYWTFGDYVGIGAGAHGKITQPDGTIYRNWKTRIPKDYLNLTHNVIAGQKVLTPKDLSFEFMMNALRLVEGVPIDYFSQRTYLAYSHIAEICQQVKQLGLLANSDQQLVATPKGLLFLNNLLEYFLS